MTVPDCILCSGKDVSVKYIKPTEEIYWDCHQCGLIFLDPKFYLSPSEELAHYQTHNNDVHDSGYQKFVSPIVDYVSRTFLRGQRGLDYGAGPGPVISFLLRKKGFEMHLYDPFFASDSNSLSQTYDFIAVCEVVEHFHSPASEFKKLKSLLKDSGSIIIKTDIYFDSTDFDSWYYHRDPTHVCFYRTKTFDWIKNNYSFQEVLETDKRTMVLKA